MKTKLFTMMILFSGPLAGQESDDSKPAQKATPETHAVPSQNSGRVRAVQRPVPRSSSQRTPPPAAQAQSRVRRVPAATLAQNTSSQKTDKSTGLKENITIQLKGRFSDGTDLDLSLTGVGPIFRSDAIAGEDQSIVTHSYTVMPAESGYKVEYSIGMRIKLTSSVSGTVTNYEYRDVMLTGTAVIKEGKNLVVATNGKHELSLTIGKAAS